MSNEAFDIWLKENYLHTNPPLIEIWQAAKADSEREIAELKAENQQYWEYIGKLQTRDNENKSYINDLREALEKLAGTNGYVKSVALQALTSTPAQSLQEHDNEVIEKCAKVVDESYAFDSDGFAKEIRALKT